MTVRKTIRLATLVFALFYPTIDVWGMPVMPTESAVKEIDGHAILFPADGIGKHASVMLLHGYSCIDNCMPDFKRYAQALNAEGIDVYFLRYYDDSDRRALEVGTLDQGSAYVERFKVWTSTVRAAVQRIRSQQRSDGRVALIGFSQGGRLAIASADNNPATQALVAFYARLPRADELNEEIKTLPPTLLLHGSADTVVPLADGQAVYAKAKSLGAAAQEMVVYPGVGHGFDFSSASTAAIDARRRVVAFMREQMP
jgi:carboxymethylenebutenolidase